MDEIVAVSIDKHSGRLRSWDNHSKYITAMVNGTISEGYMLSLRDGSFSIIHKLHDGAASSAVRIPEGGEQSHFTISAYRYKGETVVPDEIKEKLRAFALLVSN